MGPIAGHPRPMPTRIYIEALLVDPDAADRVWAAWDAGIISTYWATWMSWMIAVSKVDYFH